MRLDPGVVKEAGAPLDMLGLKAPMEGGTLGLASPPMEKGVPGIGEVLGMMLWSWKKLDSLGWS